MTSYEYACIMFEYVLQALISDESCGSRDPRIKSTIIGEV